MKEVTIKYKDSKTLEALKDLGKYLGFTVSTPKAEGGMDIIYINDVPIIRGDRSIDISELAKVFAGKELDAAHLRKSGWPRKK